MNEQQQTPINAEAQLKDEIARLKDALDRLTKPIRVAGPAALDDRLTTEIVERITPAQMASSPSGYFLSYVTTDCQGETSPCTEEIWRWSEQFSPWYDSHTNWILHKDALGKILAVTRKPILRQGPLGNRVNSGPDDLVLLKTGNVYEPAILPAKFSDNAVLQEALDGMNAAGTVKPGNTIGRFIVKQMLIDEAQTVAVLGFK